MKKEISLDPRFLLQRDVNTLNLLYSVNKFNKTDKIPYLDLYEKDTKLFETKQSVKIRNVRFPPAMRMKKQKTKPLNHKLLKFPLPKARWVPSSDIDFYNNLRDVEYKHVNNWKFSLSRSNRNINNRKSISNNSKEKNNKPEINKKNNIITNNSQNPEVLIRISSLPDIKVPNSIKMKNLSIHNSVIKENIKKIKKKKVDIFKTEIND